MSSQAICQSTSTTNSLPTAQCAQIGATGTWRNDNAVATTMEDRTLSSDFQTLAGKVVANRRSIASTALLLREQS